ncbi:hypothetical protein BMG05_12345 [Mycobacterium malmoense]|nr:hypothetical protein BMG05_12345 [Mycobacterium malmoense]
MVVDLAARPHITAGVALASAAVMAAGTMAQHLPDFQLAQHLPTVSVSDMRLSDASSALDMFSGMANELASLANGASAATVPPLLAGVVNPFQTWIDTFQTAGTNLQTLANDWLQLPAPLLQQVSANWVQYASDYVGAYQSAASGFVKYFFGSAKNDFAGTVATGVTDWMKGNFSAAFNAWGQAVWRNPFEFVGLPLEGILQIPKYITSNLSTFTNNFVTDFSFDIGLPLVTAYTPITTALSGSIGSAITDWDAGETLGAVTNVLDLPGQLTNALLNEVSLENLGTEIVALPQSLAGTIVAPNAQNIAAGGSIGAALQDFGNQLVTGWPSSSFLTNIPANLPSVLSSGSQLLASLPAQVGGAAASLASHLATLVMQLLAAL